MVHLKYPISFCTGGDQKLPSLADGRSAEQEKETKMVVAEDLKLLVRLHVEVLKEGPNEAQQQEQKTFFLGFSLLMKSFESCRMAGLNRSQLFKSGISTLATAFQRGTREEVHKNSSEFCGDVRTRCKAGQLKDSIHILNQGSILADPNTYVCLLKTCIKMKRLAEGKQVHAHIIQSGYKPNLLVLNTLINMFAKCGSVVDARLVFDKMLERDMLTWNTMIAGYAKHGCSREALEIYKLMILKGVKPDRVTFISVLGVYASLEALGKGIEVHHDILKARIAPDIILTTALVGMYAKCGSIEYARQVFDSMTQRNMVSWSVMIAGYAQHGCGREALEIYEQMIREGVTRTQVTFVCILKACASLAALEKGKEIHADIIETGIQPNIILKNTLLSMYAKCGSMKNALRVFDKIAERDVVTWSIMITGYVQQGCGREALETYEEMVREGVAPDKVTFICIVNACASLANLEKGKEIHGNIIKAGIGPDIILETALVDMYAKCGNVKDAQQVFDNMSHRNVVSWNTLITGYAHHGCCGQALQLFEQMEQEGMKPNLVSWSTMIAGYAQHGFGTEALVMYERMVRKGVTPDKVTFISVLNACASLAALEKGKEVHADIVKAGFPLDVIVETALVAMYAKCRSMKDACQVFNNIVECNVVSWSAMIAGYAQHGCGKEALQLYDQMIGKGVKPDKITFISVLNACASLAALEKGKEVHADILKAGIRSYTILENALVNMYAKCGSLMDAHQVFDSMDQRDVVSWSVMIAGYGQHGCGREALQLFEVMAQEGLKPSSITFTCLLSACSHVGLVDEGKHYFDSMSRDHGLTPKVQHITGMVDLLGRAGHMEEAEEFINKMPIEPAAAAVVWGTLLAACRTHGNVEVAERVAECLLKWDAQDAATYVLLSDIYSAAGGWEDTAKVGKMMMEMDRCHKS